MKSTLNKTSRRVRRCFILLTGIALTLSASSSLAAHVRVDLRDFTSSSLVREVGLEPRSIPNVKSNSIIVPEPIKRTTVAGVYTFSNTIAGNYLLRIYSQPPAIYYIGVPTNELVYQAKDLLTNAVELVTNTTQVVVYYTTNSSLYDWLTVANGLVAPYATSNEFLWVDVNGLVTNSGFSLATLTTSNQVVLTAVTNATNTLWANVGAADVVVSNRVNANAVAASNLSYAIGTASTNYAAATANNVSNFVKAVSNRFDAFTVALTNADAVHLQVATNYAAATANNVSNFVKAVSNRFDGFSVASSNAITAATNLHLLNATNLFSSNVIVSGTQTNSQGIWFTNVTMPLGGGSGITMYQNTNLLITNGAASVLINSNGYVGIGGFSYGVLVSYPFQVKGASYFDGEVRSSRGFVFHPSYSISAYGRAAIYSPDTNTFEMWNSTKTVAGDLRLGCVFASNAVNVSYGGSMNPVGAYGAIGMNATNIVVCAGAAGVYTNVTGFTTIVTNGFYGSIDGNSSALTNLVAGWYSVSIYASAMGANNQATEWEIFTNNVACDLVGFKKTYDAAARFDDLSASFTVYLPAGCRTDFRVQDAGTGGSIAIHRAALKIGTP